MTTTPPCLELREITKAYGRFPVLEGVGFTLARGEVRCIAGENGSGKSTLIKILSGVIPSDTGEVLFDGAPPPKGARAAIAAGISVIWQDFSLLPNLTVWENISILSALSEGARLHSRRRGRAMAMDVLKRMGVEVNVDRMLEEIPVAEKQVVAIARALANKARIIVMDEPTTALTRAEVAQLFDIVRQLQAEGVAFLFVSHKIEEVFAVCDTVTVLRDGKAIVAGPIDDFTPAALIEAMSGRPVDSQRLPRSAVVAAPPVLRVQGLTRRGDYEDVSLDLHPGEIVSIVGLLGSGRTPFAMSLFGLLPPDSGTIADAEGAFRLTSPQTAMAKGIAYVPEDRLTEALFMDQPIRDNFGVSTIEADRRGPVIDLKAMAERTREAIRRLQIKAGGPEPNVSTLSGGNAQKVVLARWMATNPRLLILNGPTVGVDVGSKRAIHELVLALSRQGCAVLVVTDDIHEAMALSDRIRVMVGGRLSGDFDAETATEEEIYAAVTADHPLHSGKAAKGAAQ